MEKRDLPNPSRDTATGNRVKGSSIPVWDLQKWEILWPGVARPKVSGGRTGFAILAFRMDSKQMQLTTLRKPIAVDLNAVLGRQRAPLTLSG